MENLLTPEDRLAILQRTDTARNWNSLDDHRVCLLCNQVITGSEVQIRVDSEGRYEVCCPTNGCAATAKDWVYPASTPSPQESPKSQTQEREMDIGALFGNTSAT